MCRPLLLTTQQSDDEDSKVENFQRNTSDEQANVKHNQRLATKDLNVRKFSAELYKTQKFQVFITG